MKPGSVIVDLAVERGGNVEGARPGEIVDTANGVKIVGYLNVPGRIAAIVLGALRQEPARLRRAADRQGRRSRSRSSGTTRSSRRRADPRRRDRASELRAQGPEPAAPRGGRTMANETSERSCSSSAQAAARRRARSRRRGAGLRRSARRRRGRGGACGDRRRDRSLRLPAVDLRAGDLRRLLRGLVGDAGAAHAADGRDQRHLLGDRRRRAARGRRRRVDAGDGAGLGARSSASSR